VWVRDFSLQRCKIYFSASRDNGITWSNESAITTNVKIDGQNDGTRKIPRKFLIKRCSIKNSHR
jgi:hypothetical protein